MAEEPGLRFGLGLELGFGLELGLGLGATDEAKQRDLEGGEIAGARAEITGEIAGAREEITAAAATTAGAALGAAGAAAARKPGAVRRHGGVRVAGADLQLPSVHGPGDVRELCDAPQRRQLQPVQLARPRVPGELRRGRSHQMRPAAVAATAVAVAATAPLSMRVVVFRRVRGRSLRRFLVQALQLLQRRHPPV